MARQANYSKKRQAIYEYLIEANEHPAAEWIYSALKPRFARLSLGTVYRNLMRFKDEGKLRSIAVVDGQERFDGDTSEHAHFICESCGAVIDLDVPLPEGIGSSIEKSGFQVSARQLFLRGHCPSCAQSKELFNKDT